MRYYYEPVDALAGSGLITLRCGGWEYQIIQESRLPEYGPEHVCFLSLTEAGVVFRTGTPPEVEEQVRAIIAQGLLLRGTE